MSDKPRQSRFSRRHWLLVVGVTLIVFGLFPWWWLDITTRLSGGRPGNEGEGMAGFLITIFIGLPGLLLTVLGLIMSAFNRRK